MRFVFALAALGACGGDRPAAHTEVTVVPLPSVTASAGARPQSAPPATTRSAEPSPPDAGDVALLGALRADDAGVAALFGPGGPGADGGARIVAFGAGRGSGGPGAGGLGLGHGGVGGSTPRVRPGVTAVSGSLPPEIIRRVIRAHVGQVRACYEDGLKKNPTLEGRVDVKFVIDTSGRVSSARSTPHSTMPDMAVVSCVVAAFRRLRFPQPKAGAVTVIYPLVFAPK
jgi:hypothetical protein